MAELSADFLDYVEIPVGAAGPQPFATSDGECYYAYKTEVRRLRDDAFVAECGPAEAWLVARTAWANGCDLLCVVVNPGGGFPTSVRGYSRELVAIDEKSGARTHLPTDLPIVELAMAPQTKRALVALATFEDGPQVYSVVATLDAEDGHEYVRQPWEVMHLRGLDCTPEGETFVCAGFVDGVQGVYLGRASAQAVPTLLARDAQYPSISADGNLVAMVHCVPTSPGEGPRFLWESNPFRENARVRILSTGDGTSQEVDFGKNVIVCGTRYVENPRRLLVTGMRTQDDGKAVWWVIWSVGSDGVATELRSWKFGEGMLIDA